MPSLRDVAEAAGVSTVTASSVLSGSNRVRVSDKTQQRIHEVARRMNYVPRAAARGLRTGRVQVIGFITSPRIHWQHQWQESLRGVSDLLWDRSERLILSLPRSEEQEAEFIRQLAFGHQVDGLILQHASENDPRIDLLRESKVPYVSLDGDAQDAHVVSFDMERFGQLLAADALQDCGALALLAGRSQSRSDREFAEGCRKGAQAAGMPLTHWEGALLPDAAWLARVRQQGGDRPLALVLARQLLPELAAVLNEAGLAMERDVRVIYLAGLEEIILPPPGLNVLHLDHYTLGRQAGKLLFQLIDDRDNAPPPGRKLILPSVAENLLRQV